MTSDITMACLSNGFLESKVECPIIGSSTLSVPEASLPPPAGTSSRLEASFHSNCGSRPAGDQPRRPASMPTVLDRLDGPGCKRRLVKAEATNPLYGQTIPSESELLEDRQSLSLHITEDRDNSDVDDNSSLHMDNCPLILAPPTRKEVRSGSLRDRLCLSSLQLLNTYRLQNNRVTFHTSSLAKPKADARDAARLHSVSLEILPAPQPLLSHNMHDLHRPHDLRPNGGGRCERWDGVNEAPNNGDHGDDSESERLLSNAHCEARALEPPAAGANHTPAINHVVPAGGHCWSPEPVPAVCHKQPAQQAAQSGPEPPLLLNPAWSPEVTPAASPQPASKSNKHVVIKMETDNGRRQRPVENGAGGVMQAEPISPTVMPGTDPVENLKVAPLKSSLKPASVSFTARPDVMPSTVKKSENKAARNLGLPSEISVDDPRLKPKLKCECQLDTDQIFKNNSGSECQDNFFIGSNDVKTSVALCDKIWTTFLIIATFLSVIILFYYQNFTKGFQH